MDYRKAGIPVTYPILPSQDVDETNDFASESVGIDSGTGMWVICADGKEIRFSEEVEHRILYGLAELYHYSITPPVE